jgi:ankyrin repeat protein
MHQRGTASTTRSADSSEHHVQTSLTLTRIMVFTTDSTPIEHAFIVSRRDLECAQNEEIENRCSAEMEADVAAAPPPPPPRFALHDAAEAGDAEALTALLAQAGDGDDEFVPDDDGDDDDLSDSGVGLESRDRYGCTPLHVALLHAHVDCARVCVENGAEVLFPCNGSPCLHLAVSAATVTGNDAFGEAAVALLVEAGASVDSVDDNGRTALHLIAWGGSAAVADALFRAADASLGSVAVDARDRHGCTPLHLAARGGHIAMAKLLLQRGAHAGVQDEHGNTPAHVAAYCGHADLLPLLTCDDVANAWGATPSQLFATAFGAARAAVSSLPTCVFTHTSSLSHLTCGDVGRRAKAVPPENVNRLHVLLHAAFGVLRAPEFHAVKWNDAVPQAKVRARGLLTHGTAGGQRDGGLGVKGMAGWGSTG